MGMGGGGRGYGGGGGEDIDTYHYTVTTRMTSALRWASSDESRYLMMMMVIALI